ncbi:MAG: class I SAM-dependent methyltransferase [Proteobacteria bacterium]|nr:class I SAM-dependent methyltransferase [Pseudomonadota bacterium]MCP4918546.1 class I SAM-dependent methyltransferase [Pseudomonadota bacterium]
MSAATFWDGLAEEYAAKSVELPDAFDKKTELTRTLLRPDSRMLDVGCGTGSFLLRLAPSAGELHGLDFSSGMIGIAHDKARDVSNVTFHVGELEGAPFEPGSFDLVSACSILHLIEDRKAALERLYELVAPGGHFVHSTVVLGESWVPMSAMVAVMRFFGKAPWVGDFSKAELDEDLRAAGFVDIQHHEVGQKNTTAFATARKPAASP